MTELPDPSVREPEGAYFTTYGELAPGQPYRRNTVYKWTRRSSLPVGNPAALGDCVQALPAPAVMVTITADLLERLANGDRDEFNVHNALERVRLAREAAGR